MLGACKHGAGGGQRYVHTNIEQTSPLPTLRLLGYCLFALLGLLPILIDNLLDLLPIVIDNAGHVIVIVQ